MKTWEKEVKDIYYKPWGTHPADKVALLKAFIAKNLSRALARERTQLLKEVREEFDKFIEWYFAYWYIVPKKGKNQESAPINYIKSTVKLKFDEQLKKLKELEKDL